MIEYVKIKENMCEYGYTYFYKSRYVHWETDTESTTGIREEYTEWERGERERESWNIQRLDKN